MNEHTEPNGGVAADATTESEATAVTANAMTPLPGEAGLPEVSVRPKGEMSTKGMLAFGMACLAIVIVLISWYQHYYPGGKTPDADAGKQPGDRPAAATVEARRLDMSRTAAVASSSASASASSPMIPAGVPSEFDAVDPIGVRRTDPKHGPTGTGGTPSISPQDAPVLLVSTRPDATVGASNATEPSTGPNADPGIATTRHLQGYQRQLQGLLDTLTRSTATAVGQVTGTAPPGAVSTSPTPFTSPAQGAGSLPGAGLFGGQLQASATPRVMATALLNPSLTLPKGSAFTCALKTRVISAASGMASCQVQRNVFSADGRVLLVERGSHLDGEYRITSVRPGTVRIPVLWTRIRTPNGVSVDIESPGTGALGESGIDGHVDNRWLERIGAAMLLSLIDDSVKLVIQNQAHDTQSSTLVLPSTTSNASKLAEKVLDSTINIPPLIYQNQGAIVGIYVARDVDFSSVYELMAVSR